MSSVFQLTSLTPTSAVSCQHSFRTLTVMFSNGWRVTSIQLHVDGFYLMVLFCQSQRFKSSTRQTDARCVMQLQSWLHLWIWLPSSRHALLPHPQLYGTLTQKCTETCWLVGALTSGMADCWLLSRATAKLVVKVDEAVVEQKCPAPLFTAVWDLHSTVKRQ